MSGHCFVVFRLKIIQNKPYFIYELRRQNKPYFIYELTRQIIRSNEIYRLIHGHFHIGLVIMPRPILARDALWGSRDDNQANMEMPMY